MALLDLSFNNVNIANYFNGDNSYIPSSELMYIHSHPLIRPNFLTDISTLINTVSVTMQSKGVTGMPVEDLAGYAKELAAELQSLSESNAPAALDLLRKIYVYCNNLLKTLN
jgi:hypothetical protein